LKKNGLITVICIAIVFVSVSIVQSEVSSGNIEQAIRRAEAFLYAQQEPNGDFPSRVCRTVNGEGCRIHKGSVFSTTFVLYSLQFLPVTEKRRRMLKKGHTFIDSKRQPGDLWRFCGTIIDYDLDDISCASYLLESLGYALENKKQIYDNRDENNIFKTWIRQKETDHNDIEGVVNANALLYLGENKETVDACNWIVNAVKSGKEDDILTYYPDSAVLFYTLSRAFFQKGLPCVEQAVPLLIVKISEKIPQYIEQHDFLNAALLLNALLNLGYDVKALKNYADFFVEHQAERGSWESSLFFMAVDLPKAPSSYFFSESVTTALTAEFLYRIR